MDQEPAWIEEFLTNNHVPTDEEAQEVRKLLVEPLGESEGLDAEIFNLRNRLSELVNKRYETQKRISRYETILSPIRHVPPDVLGEIFYHCLPIHRNPMMASSDCPLLFTRVCSTWRTTAMSTPKLWDRLYITFTDDDTVPDLESVAEMVRNGQDLDGWRNALTKVLKQRTTELLRRRYEAVKEWFVRAGTRPLSISMHFTATPWYAVPYSERPPSVTMEFLSYLASLAPRWREFEVKASMTVYRALEKMLPVSQMGALTSLRGEYHLQFPETEDATRPLKLLQAPNLRHISMSAVNTKVWGIPDRSFTQWNNLTSISCFDSLSIAETTFLLEHASSLVHYKGVISEHGMDNTPTVYEGLISLPSLRSLSITEYLNPQRLGNIYDRIDAPKLQSVKYAGHFIPAEFSVVNPAPMLIFALLHKSTELQKLSVDTTDLTVWDVRTLLRAVPSVVDLVLGQEDDPLNSSMIPTMTYIDYDTSGFLNRELWSFSDFVVDSSSEDLEDGSHLLLPRLTSLVISSSTARISDDTLFDLIKSRLISSKTVALARVQGRFYRERERDIVKELTAYAELVGVKIDLDFKYAQLPPLSVNSTSPKFGLRGKDGRTWPYIDAGEGLC